MKRYRIGMVAACPFPAAFASAGLIRELTLSLVQHGHEVHVITYHLGDMSFPIPDVPIHRIPNVPGYQKLSSGIAATKPLLDLLLAKTLLRVSKLHRFDIIHAHNYEAPPAGYFTRKILRIPVVYHAHNTMFHELPTYFHNRAFHPLLSWLGHKLDRMIPHRADHIITVSKEQTDYLATLGIPRNRMTLIPPCVSSAIFQHGNGSLIRTRLGLGDRPVVLYTGGLQPYQNCRILIDVLRHCLVKIPDIHFLILARSEPRWLQNLAVSAQVSNHIHFIQGQGLQFEKDCLAAADVGILPRENCIGFPVKLLNYTAAGIPVVCFDGLNKGFRDEIDLLAAPVGDVAAMSERIVRLINDKNLCRSLTASAQQRLADHHSWIHAIEALNDIYNRVLSMEGTCRRQ